MRKIFAIALLAILTVGVVAAPADAWGRRGGRVFVGVGLGFYGAYPYYYYPPPYYYYPPAVVYTAPPPPAVYTEPAPAPAAPAVQREVIYPHGKYVLEGDGVQTPYRWVWVANTTETPQPSAPAPAAPSESR